MGGGVCSQPMAGQQPGAQRSAAGPRPNLAPRGLGVFVLSTEHPRDSRADDGALISNASTQLLTMAVPAQSQHMPCPHSCSWRPFPHPTFGGTQTWFPAGTSSRPLYPPICAWVSAVCSVELCSCSAQSPRVPHPALLCSHSGGTHPSMAMGPTSHRSH